MGQHSNSAARKRRRRLFTTLFVTALVAAGTAITGSAAAQQNPSDLPFEIQSLDGSGNNRANPDWGLAGNDYSRVANIRYADGIGQMVTAPSPRLISNRIFNDTHQNIFSERNVTQWGFAWGQFLDHTFGLRLGRLDEDPTGEPAPIPFNPNDPIEEFENDLGVIGFERSAISPGSGVNSPRQQINTVNSYISGWPVYGGTTERLEWLRNGSVDGNIGNNQATLLLPDGYLPRAETRGDPATAPLMDTEGFLELQPQRAAIAGDVRANENIGLTATHTLFAREHNRIVSLLPGNLTQEQKFQIARRVVIAEQQYITYNEFLPSIGVTMPAYTGYRSNINTDLSNEFATVGYRAHSMIHGEIEFVSELDRYSAEDQAALEELGLELEIEGDEVEVAIPLAVAFFNPDLVELVQLGPLLQGLGLEAQYNNDEQIDNQLRSVLFQIPVENNPECLDGPGLPECFEGVTDLGAIDIQRGFDHGIPSYNQLRQAYGLAPKTSFTAITGESTDQLPPGLGINDPAILDIVELRDIDGNVIDPADEDAVDGEARSATRATTVAARLRAIFGSVNNVDAFTGMLAERHVSGSDMGELQRAIWTREFTRLRDGDRFFYGNNPGLSAIRQQFGIDFRTSLGDVIARNTDIPRDEMNENVFLVDDEEATNCQAAFTVVDQWSTGFLATVTVTNTGTTPINGWSTNFRFPTGQVIQDSWNTRFTQSGPDVTMSVASGNWQGNLAPGQSATGWMRASWDGATNARPTHYALNGGRCTT